MVTKKEIKEHLAKALEEVGKIKPWYDKEVSAWVFSHEKYPVECAGDSKKEVIETYPLYLREFIEHRLLDKLSSLMEKKTKGRGGLRPGAGRPKGTKGPVKKRVYVSKKLAPWLKLEENLGLVEELSFFIGEHQEAKSRELLKRILQRGVNSLGNVS